MGYRLHANIPNVEYADNDLELGKQYNVRWDYFNDNWFGESRDGGMIAPYEFDDFLRDLKIVNSEIIKNKEGFDLYNIELLEKMFEFAKEKNYFVYFESY